MPSRRANPPVAGQQFEYGFDDIGNRKNTKVGGDQNGANLRPANYTNNTLNQITSRGVPGYVDVMGLALATNTVTVNGQATYRKGEYFRKELSVNNSSAPVWQSVSVAAAGETTVAGNVLVRKTPETFGYDADGNLTNDGRWTFTWDAENRLTKAESLASNPTASKRRVVWEFDGQGRRIRQTTYNGSSGSYVVTEDLKFLSDGWRHLAELNATNNALVRSYVWGLDLSGSLDGAGGVGGLLVMNSAANGAHFCAYDGNGNLTTLVKAADGKPSAHYEYGPFGEALRVTGAMGNENPFRFSTKRADTTTDLVLYEYRVYIPSLGRCLSRDPIGEEGGSNLYGFLDNAPPLGWDYLGQQSQSSLTYDWNIGDYNRWTHPDWSCPNNWRDGLGRYTESPYKGSPSLPKIPTRRSGGGRGGGKSGGISDAMLDAAKKFNEGTLARLLAKGRADCRKQRPWSASCPGCCVVPIGKVLGCFTGEPTWHVGAGYVVDKPCSQVEREHQDYGVVTAYYGNSMRDGFVRRFLRSFGLTPRIWNSDQEDSTRYFPIW